MIDVKKINELIAVARGTLDRISNLVNLEKKKILEADNLIDNKQVVEIRKLLSYLEDPEKAFLEFLSLGLKRQIIALEDMNNPEAERAIIMLKRKADKKLKTEMNTIGDQKKKITCVKEASFVLPDFKIPRDK